MIKSLVRGLVGSFSGSFWAVVISAIIGGGMIYKTVQWWNGVMEAPQKVIQLEKELADTINRHEVQIAQRDKIIAKQRQDQLAAETALADEQKRQDETYRELISWKNQTKALQNEKPDYKNWREAPHRSELDLN